MPDFIEQSREHLSSFTETCCENDPVPYCLKGILNIEAFYWWSLVGCTRPDIILESGVSQGRSTEILARAQSFFNVPYHFAFDAEDKHQEIVRNRLSKYKTIYTIRKSYDGFREILDANKESSILAIIDGPKSGRYFLELFNLLRDYKILAVGCHDCSINSKTRNDMKKAVRKYLPKMNVYFTNEKINSDIVHLNKYIDFGSVDTVKIEQLLENSNYVGIATKG